MFQFKVSCIYICVNSFNVNLISLSITAAAGMVDGVDGRAAQGDAAGRETGGAPSGTGRLAPTHHRSHHEATATGHGSERRTLQTGEAPHTPH